MLGGTITLDRVLNILIRTHVKKKQKQAIAYVI